MSMNRSNRGLPFSSFTAFGLSFFRYRTISNWLYQPQMRLTLLAFILAEISLPGHCNSDCTFLLQRSTPGTRPQLQLSQPFALDEQVKAEHGHVGPTRIPCVIHPGKPTSFHTTRLKFQQLGSWRIQNVNINCGTTQRLQSDTPPPEISWFDLANWEALSPVQRADIFRYLVLWIKEATMQTSMSAVRSPLQSFLSPKLLAWLSAMKLHVASEKRNEKLSDSLVLSSLSSGSLHQPQATLYCSVAWKLYERNSFGEFRIPWNWLVLQASVMLCMSFWHQMLKGKKWRQEWRRRFLTEQITNTMITMISISGISHSAAKASTVLGIGIFGFWLLGGQLSLAMRRTTQAIQLRP